MIYEEYITEFYSTLQSRVFTWVEELGMYSSVGPFNVSHTFGCYVNFLNYHLRDEYCRLRHEGLSAEKTLDLLLTLPNPKVTDLVSREPEVLSSHPLVANWKEILTPLMNRKIYYANLQRMADYIMPFVQKETGPTLVISDSTIVYSKYTLPDHVTALQFVDARMRLYRNDFLEREFTTFFSYVNTIILLDGCLMPPEFNCICGCQSQAKIWATIARARGAVTTCYQHGWPAFMHTAFKNMPYDRMVT